ncbi:cupin domain-containing protein [Cochlodiniinecator piscidefendens]|uniref:cupin domain-containing protein n=1 Tax=Cochlodiniinecator piscidefendens TaxID=2715756 RepID=UPI001407936D|nr:DUF4437 domain-containing protein [Cochlodiniinecator piscidefendens]
MKKAFFSMALIVALSATPVLAADIELIGADDITWETTPEGVAFAALQGNRFEETYQAMVRLPAGIVSPPHVKSANMYGVMLQGEMVHYPQGADPEGAQRMGAGSYYHIPSGLAHVSACVSAEPCVAYLYQDGAFDFLPMQQ